MHGEKQKKWEDRNTNGYTGRKIIGEMEILGYQIY